MVAHLVQIPFTQDATCISIKKAFRSQTRVNVLVFVHGEQGNVKEKLEQISNYGRELLGYLLFNKILI
jgi:hypothetical protein